MRCQHTERISQTLLCLRGTLLRNKCVGHRIERLLHNKTMGHVAVSVCAHATTAAFGSHLITNQNSEQGVGRWVDRGIGARCRQQQAEYLLHQESEQV